MADSSDSVVGSTEPKYEDKNVSEVEEQKLAPPDKEDAEDSEDKAQDTSRPQTPISIKSEQKSAFSTPNLNTEGIKQEPTTPRTPVISTPPGTPYSCTPDTTTTSENNTPTTSTPNTSTPNTPKNKLPHRWGINWRKGEKLEALDYMNKWYLAKIREIDYTEQSVLIHFEGWNSRFDEWFTTDSERLRPVTRSSGRPQKRKLDGEYNVGEKVLAKWSDSKMYAARIEAANTDGSYSVKFEDGFKKICLPSHIKPFPDHKHHRKRPDYKEIKHPGQADTPKSSKKPTTPVAKTPEPLGSSSKRKDNSASKPKGKLIVAGSFLVKREKSVEETTPKIKSEKPKDTPAKIKKEIEDTPVKIKKESEKTVKIKKEKEPEKVKKAKEVKKEKVFGKVNIKKEKNPEKKKDKRRNSLSPKVKLSPIENKLAVLKKSKKKAFSTATVILSPEDCGVSAAKRAKISDKPNTAPKEFVVETDHNPFKCISPNCGKSFRKESLLDSHIKFYHSTNETKSHTMSAPRKRQKTSSICSSDSDHSVTSSSKGKSPLDPKRKRHVSMDIGVEETVPSTLDVDLTEEDETKPVPSNDVTLSSPSIPVSTPRRNCSQSQEPLKAEDAEESAEVAGDPDPTAYDEEEEEDEEENDDVAHCECGYHVEDGLMIQCEVCLSWQHAACFNITENSLPKKYICYVCINPRGVRDSKKYIYEQDWLKQGALPVFNFLPGKVSSVRTEEMQQTQDLAAEIHKLSATLHALKTQLNAIRQKNHPAVKLWQTNWDDLPSDHNDTAQMDEYISMDTSSPSTSAGPSGQLLNYLNYSAFLAQVAEGKEVTDLNCEDSSTDSVVSNRSVLLDEDDSNQKLPETSGSTSHAAEPALDAETGLLKGGGDEEQPGPSTSGGGGDPLARAREKMEAAILEKCEKNMLQHIIRVQSEINSRLDTMEDKILVLETKEGLSGNEDLPPTAPRLKRAIRNNIRDVHKLKLMSELCGTKPRKQH